MPVSCQLLALNVFEYAFGYYLISPMSHTCLIKYVLVQIPVQNQVARILKIPSPTT